MPAQFRSGIPLTGRIAEAIRDLGRVLITYDPLMRLTFSQACTIACTTAETLAAIPRRFHPRCIVQPAIGINEEEIEANCGGPDLKPHFLYVGRLVYWKGAHLALRALAEVRKSVPQARLKIIGDGSDRNWLKAVAQIAGVMDCVEWLPSKPHDEILHEYRGSLAFVFPSLHDSGGMVALEALAAGVPVVCLDLGGPGTIVTSSCGIVVESRRASERFVVESLAEALLLLATDGNYRARLSAGASERAQQMTWDIAAQTLSSSLNREKT